MDDLNNQDLVEEFADTCGRFYWECREGSEVQKRDELETKGRALENELLRRMATDQQLMDLMDLVSQHVEMGFLGTALRLQLIEQWRRAWK